MREAYFYKIEEQEKLDWIPPAEQTTFFVANPYLHRFIIYIHKIDFDCFKNHRVSNNICI